MRGQYKKYASFLGTALLTIPFVHARTGVGALDLLVDTLVNVFRTDAMRSETAQLIIFKLIYFFMIFAILNVALKQVGFLEKGGENGNRSAAIIAFSISAIATIFMPRNWALMTGGLITAIFAMIIPLALTGIVLWVSFKKLNDEWWQHLLAALIILFAINLIGWIIALVG